MTYASDQASVQSSRPREIYDIVIGGDAYRYTSYSEDIVFGGLTYASIVISRGATAILNVTKRRELLVTMPADHELVRLLIGSGIPPRPTSLTITSIEAGGATLQIWSGRIAGVSAGEQFAQLSITHRMDHAFDRKLPVLKTQPTCNYTVYGPGCDVSRAGHPFFALGSYIWLGAGGSHVILPQISAATGTTILINGLSGKPSGFGTGGEIRRFVNGQSDARSIIRAVGLELTIDCPFPSSKPFTVGEYVQVWQGCALTVNACRDDFDNVPNFGGHPDMPPRNPVGPFGTGLRST